MILEEIRRHCSALKVIPCILGGSIELTSASGIKVLTLDWLVTDAATTATELSNSAGLVLKMVWRVIYSSGNWFCIAFALHAFFPEVPNRY